MSFHDRAAFEALRRDLAREERRGDEAERISATLDAGFVPADCGPEIPVAPARGPVRAVEARALYPKGRGEYEVKPAGYRGRKVLHRCDVFDVMAARAARHGKASPFSAPQVAIGRYYRDLVERHACAGLGGTSLETLRSGGGGSGGEFIDAVLRDGQRVAALRRRMEPQGRDRGEGPAVVLVVQRRKDGDRRQALLLRTLVDDVCLRDLPLASVLRRHGWAVDKAKTRALAEALGQALDRMIGPVRGGIRALRDDAAAGEFMAAVKKGLDA